MSTHHLFDRLRALRTTGLIPVAHRGDSRRHPENTLAAFRAATSLGVPVQEFDVRQLRDGELVCMHDATFDRTTDAARRLGPGALVAGTDMAVARTLDAGSWRGAVHAGERVPLLAEAIAAMQPASIPMIERKAGAAARFTAVLRQMDAAEKCIVQSFDWQWCSSVRALAPEMAIAVLGPNDEHAELDEGAIAAAVGLGAGMVHWDAAAVGRREVERAHAAGLLVCTYTTDDELGWRGGAAVGIDAMCTNDPAAMLAALR